MQELLIVNPSRRPSKRRKSTKAASPAQKRARAAFAKMARSRAKPRKAAKRRKPSTSLTIMSNPRKRPAKRAKRRRNPSSRSLIAKPMALLTPALMGAVGATAVNTILAKLPVPAAMNTGKMRYVTQAAAAIALGAIASKLGVKGAMAAQMAEGSLTVTLHQAITEVATGMGMNLSGMGYYLPGYGVSAGPNARANPARLAGMGKYVTGPGSANVTQMNQPVRQAQKMRGFNF